ncbi:MAG: creatininase family protein [Sulfolobales archaeon]
MIKNVLGKIPAGFPVSVYVNPDAFYLYTKSVLKEISRDGFRYIVVLNEHDRNSYLIRSVSQEMVYKISNATTIIEW